MSYVKVESTVRLHPKFLKAGPAASWLWLCGLAHCQEALTDGFIADEALPFLGVPNARRLAAVLVDVGLWHTEQGGWRVHDYLDHNNSASDIRRIADERRKAGRKGGQSGAAGPPHLRKQFASMFAEQDVHQLEEQSANGVAKPAVTVPVRTEKQEQAPDGAGCSLNAVETRMLVAQHRRNRSRETIDGKPAIRVIAALARHLITTNPELASDEGELMERVKQACARANLNYAGAVGPAIDRARAQLARVAGARAS